MKNQILISKKEEQIKALNITLLLVKNDLKALKNEKETTFSARELNFSKDADNAICKKYHNKKYQSKKSEILIFIKKKFEAVKIRKERTDKIYLTFQKFFDELEKDEKLFN